MLFFKVFSIMISSVRDIDIAFLNRPWSYSFTFKQSNINPYPIKDNFPSPFLQIMTISLSKTKQNEIKIYRYQIYWRPKAIMRFRPHSSVRAPIPFAQNLGNHHCTNYHFLPFQLRSGLKVISFSKVKCKKMLFWKTMEILKFEKD